MLCILLRNFTVILPCCWALKPWNLEHFTVFTQEFYLDFTVSTPPPHLQLQDVFMLCPLHKYGKSWLDVV